MIEQVPDSSVIYSLVLEGHRLEGEIDDLKTEAARKKRLADAARESEHRAFMAVDHAVRRRDKIQEAIVVLADAESLDLKVIEVWRRSLRGEGSIEELRKKVGV